MAHHYYSGEPIEACLEKLEDLEFDENITVPGQGTEYSIDFELEPGQFIHDGEVVEASVVAGMPIFENFMDKANDEVLEVFLGYAENDWTSEELWRETDLGRDQVYSITQELEEDYGFISTEFGDIELMDKGQKFYSAFNYLTEET